MKPYGQMKISINRSIVEVPEGVTLGEVLTRENLAGTGVAVAVDNKVVARNAWPEFVLSGGMKLTVIKAVCGG